MTYENQPYGIFDVDGQQYESARWSPLCWRGSDDPNWPERFEISIVEYTHDDRVPPKGVPALLYLVVGTEAGCETNFESFDQALDEAISIAWHEAFEGGFRWDTVFDDRVPSDEHLEVDDPKPADNDWPSAGDAARILTVDGLNPFEVYPQPMWVY